MKHIELSEKTVQEFEKLKVALKEVYNWQEISDDQILEAMIMWFWDSLEHIKNAQHGHHHNGHDCCGKCEHH